MTLYEQCPTSVFQLAAAFWHSTDRAQVIVYTDEYLVVPFGHHEGVGEVVALVCSAPMMAALGLTLGA